MYRVVFEPKGSGLKAEFVLKPNASERALVQRALRGDPDAIAHLYETYADEIFRFCLVRVRDRAVAEDLTGEVFINMVEALPRYVDLGVPFRAWLYRIAHARAMDFWRRMARRPSTDLQDDLPDGTPSPEQLTLQQLDAHALRAAMQELTEEQRQVIQLRFVEGYRPEETARLMNKTEGAVKALQHRALRQLAKRLKP